MKPSLFFLLACLMVFCCMRIISCLYPINQVERRLLEYELTKHEGVLYENRNTARPQIPSEKTEGTEHFYMGGIAMIIQFVRNGTELELRDGEGRKLMSLDSVPVELLGKKFEEVTE